MRKILTIALFFCGTIGIYAQEDRVMTLDECIKIAKENSLALKNAQLAVQQAKDMQGTSFTLEATAFTLEQDLTGGGNPDNSLAVGQTFELPSVYKARRKALKKQTEVESAKESMTVNAVEMEIINAYNNIRYAREKFKLLQKQDSVIQQFHAVAKSKTNAGDVSSLDHINAHRMMAESEMKTVAAKNEYRTAQYKMAQLLNETFMVVPADESWEITETTVAKPTREPTRVASPTPLFVADNTTAMQLANNMIAASESELKNVRNEGLPTISLEGKYQVLIKGLNPYNIERPRFENGNFLAMAVGVNIPLCFGSQAAKVRAAKRGVEMERNNMEQLQRELQAEYYEKYNEWVNTKMLVEYYKESGLQQAAEMEQIASEAYRNNEINYVELMQNMQAATDMRLQYMDAVNEYNRQVMELNYMCK